MYESEYLFATLDSLASQHFSLPFDVFVCVNQPESFWQNADMKHICVDNAKTLDMLSDYRGLRLRVLDKSSPGNGWPQKKSGVGFARRLLFDTILKVADNDDIVISLDADTTVRCGYIASIYDNFAKNPDISAISVPYYHKIDECNNEHSKSILRYELYMRNYMINMLHTGSPYSFTALGSAIAVRASALRKIGNITPYQSGEDFYLLQKIRKSGLIGNYNEECVYPSPRLSLRVPFGTGPAVARGVSNNWQSYPIYHHSLFEPVRKAYDLLPHLYTDDKVVKENDFLGSVFNDAGATIAKIKSNVSDYEHFEKAFHQKADGLRIMQFVRQSHSVSAISDATALASNIGDWFPECFPSWLNDCNNLFDLSVEKMNFLRNILFDEEQRLRKGDSNKTQ